MKTQTASQKAKNRTSSDAHAVVDEFSELSTELENLGVFPKLKRLEALKAEVKKLAEDLPPEEEVTLRGYKSTIVLTPCLTMREVEDTHKLMHLLGRAKFNMLATFSLNALASELTKRQIDSVCRTYYGSRKLKDISYPEIAMH